MLYSKNYKEVRAKNRSDFAFCIMLLVDQLICAIKYFCSVAVNEMTFIRSVTMNTRGRIIIRHENLSIATFKASEG